MSIASEITRISNNIVAAYTALDAKGATLPAAGSQNSANLADTIDTITTGGGGSGGSGFRPPIYNFIDAEVDKITYTTKFADIENDGWTLSSNIYNTDWIMSSNDSYKVRHIEAFVFTDDIPALIKVNLNDTGVLAYKIPQDASLVQIGSSSTYNIDFVNCDEKWILIADAGMAFNQTHLYWGNTVSNLTFSTYARNYIKYIAGKNITETYASSTSTQQILSSLNPLCNLEDFYFPNIKDSLGVNNNNLSFDSVYGLALCYNDKLTAEQVASYYSNVTRKVTTITNGYRLVNEVGRTCGIAGISSSPFIYDCSGDSTSETVFIGCPKHYDSYSGSYYVHDYKYTPREFFFIPSSSWNLAFCPLDNNNGLNSNTSFCDRMTTESYKFLADNAPNVSGKTIYILSTTKDRLNSEDSTIMTTLESKGYTITTK